MSPIIECLLLCNAQSIPCLRDRTKKEKRKTQLQELERCLFDDDVDEEEDVRNCSAVFALTTNEWSETVQNLVTPKPLPTAPATSSSSSSSTTTSSSPSQATPNSSYKQLLMDSAAMISKGKIEIATSIIAGLKRASNALPEDLEPRQSLGCRGA